jgi:AcrR family transcriptional regulator
MSEETPLPERILDTAEAVLRRHGAEKANVVDIARALGMSHGNIYRHFPSKKAILDAVAARWLNKIMAPLELIANDRGHPAPERLASWFHTLRAAKRRKVLDDPELFQVYHGIVKNMRGTISEHVEGLLGQLEQIIADGVEQGHFFRSLDPKSAARAFLQASSSFHHPALIVHHCPTDEEAQAVFAILLSGLIRGPEERFGKSGDT